MNAAPRLGTRPLDRLRSRLGLFRGHIHPYFATNNDAPMPDGAGPIEQAFYEHDGRVVHKMHHYLPLYDRYFGPYRQPDRPIRMLEIGVSEGGSLELWRSYFGPTAVIFSVDIDPACAALDGEGDNCVRIGSQADPGFLRSVVAEMGGLDIVLDDGSHVAADLRSSFDTLFPLLADDGLYILEDLQTSYWANFGGGYFSRLSGIGLLKTLIDDIHHWYHPNGQKIDAARNRVAGIHVHDGIAFIEKGRRDKAPDKSFRGGVTKTGKA